MTTETKAIWITPDNPEWDSMWEDLRKVGGMPPGEFADENPDNGELWQYMGSVIERFPTFDEASHDKYHVVHGWRHRDRPTRTPLYGCYQQTPHTGRVYLAILASQDCQHANGCHPVTGPTPRVVRYRVAR